MTGKTTSSRRGFLKGGAFVAAPFAVGAPAAALADDGLKARARQLEDEAAIRRAQQDFLRQVNLAGGHDLLDDTVRAIAADHAGEVEAIAIADDGRTATARMACIAERETDLPRDNTLAQMAHAQGSGAIRTAERQVLTARYRKTEKGWVIDEVTLA